MSSKHFHVTNAYVDRETGKTIQPGEIVQIDDDRVDAFRRADVIGKEATKAEVAAAKKADDGGEMEENGGQKAPEAEGGAAATAGKDAEDNGGKGE